MATPSLATKYSSQVDEVFRLSALTTEAVNNDYDWDGVHSLVVFDMPTVANGAYTAPNTAFTGTSRYGGAPNDIGNNTTTYTPAEDRAFNFIIDRRSAAETVGTMDAGKALRRQLEVAVIPEIDSYRIGVWEAQIGTNGAGTGWVAADVAATTGANAYTNFLDTNQLASNNQVPITGRRGFMTFNYYNSLKQTGTNGSFVLASEAGQATRGSGVLGNVDGVEVVAVPTGYFSASGISGQFDPPDTPPTFNSNVDLIVVHPIATVSPILLTDYMVHENPPGINGWLVEGRFKYDSFVLAKKVKAIVGHKVA